MATAGELGTRQLLDFRCTAEEIRDSLCKVNLRGVKTKGIKDDTSWFWDGIM